MNQENEIDAGRVVAALKFVLAFAFLCLSLVMAIPVLTRRSRAGSACRLLKAALPQLSIKVDEIQFTKQPTAERCLVMATVSNQNDEQVLRDFLSSKLTDQQRELTGIVIEVSNTTPTGKNRAK